MTATQQLPPSQPVLPNSDNFLAISMAVGVGETLVVPFQVHKVEGSATIGSAAQVSIINTMLFEQLPGNLQQAEIVRLKGICTKNNTIPAIRIVGVKITLGRNEFGMFSWQIPPTLSY